MSEATAKQYLKTPEGQLYLERVLQGARDIDSSPVKIYATALEHLTSGKELPRMEMNSEPLVKIVAKGRPLSEGSPYWAREADLDAAIREGKNLHEFFGLPVGSESAQYDVYRIHPKSPTEVWVSTVAPTSELDGKVQKPGGATQYLTPNRKLYTEGELIKTVDNRLQVPLRDAERERPKPTDHENSPHRSKTAEMPEASEAHSKPSSSASAEPHARINAGAVRGAAKVAGVAGTVYGAYDSKNQVDAAVDTARSTREQWVKGAEETANQAAKTVVTGAAAAVGSVPGAAAGALTSPVTGPVGPVVGGLATGGAAAYGAEKLYEESVPQRATKFVGRKAGDIGYDYISKEGRLLREVNGLKEDLSEARDPAERTRIQGQLDKASAAFNKEAERNNRYFEGREKIDRVWEKMHARIPNVDKDDVNAALARHIDAGKRPVDAVRGAFSDAVHEKYPRALHHEPLENYRALTNEQLLTKHRQYSSELAQDQRKLDALVANKDSHNNIDQGWPKALAEQRQANRVEEGKNELWRDNGHLTAVRQAMKERGLKEPEPDQGRTSASGSVALTAAQEHYRQQARDQLAPGLRSMGMSEDHISRVTAAAVHHAQRTAHGGPLRGFHLSHNGERVAVVQDGGPHGVFSVKEAVHQPAQQHLAHAHEAAQVQAQAQVQGQDQAQQQRHGQDQAQSQPQAAPPVQEQAAMAR